MMSLYNSVVIAFAIFGAMSLFILIQHEVSISLHPLAHQDTNNKAPASAARLKRGDRIRKHTSHHSADIVESFMDGIKFNHNENKRDGEFHDDDGKIVEHAAHHSMREHRLRQQGQDSTHNQQDQQDQQGQQDVDVNKHEIKIENALMQEELELQDDDKNIESHNLGERKGLLVCNGSLIDSEVVYWKIVPGDDIFESPITPHHGQHDDRYLSFEYDAGGWNNVRMGMECLIVVAHAMGRTLVVPPQQHLYLLGETHKDKEDKVAHDEMGFEDFFGLDLLRSHKGFHIMHMEEFLAKEGITGGLKGMVPPGNTTKLWGQKLWWYLKKVSFYHD